MDDHLKKEAVKIPGWDRVMQGLRGNVASGAREGIREGIEGAVKDPSFRENLKTQLRQIGIEGLKAVGPGAAAGGAAAGVGAHLSDRDVRNAVAKGALIGGLTGGLGSRMIGKVGPAESALIGGVTGLPAGLLGKKKQETPMKNKYAGVTLDWYDDKGATLKSKFPTPASLPSVIKEADIKPKEKLAHEDFALVAVDEGNVLRKFACHDPGTTAMSVIYFMEHGDKLPDGAQKLAASNLVNACREFGLAPPAALEKVAAGVLHRLLRTPAGIGGALGAGIGGVGGGVMGAASADEGERLKGGLKGLGVGTLAGGLLGAGSGALQAHSSRLGARLAGAPKGYVDPELEAIMAGSGGLIGGGAGAALGGVAAEGSKKEASIIDITGKRPTPRVKIAQPTSNDDYAVVLEDGRRLYPINTWDLVKKAEVYYHEEGIRMHPGIRRQFATKLAAKAAVLGFPLDPDIFDAGSPTFAAPGHLKAAVEMRKIACAPRSNERAFLDDLFEKRASMGPEIYSECLRRFDVQTGLDQGWDRVVLDPWASTFGIDKTAKVVWEHGADKVTEDQIKNLAQNRTAFMDKTFGSDFLEEFLKDPIGIFESLPDPQKKVFARLAADASSDGDTEVMTSASVVG